MASVPLCEAPLAAVKQSLRDEFPSVQSSHLSEALAYCLNFRTHASLQAAMVGPEADRPFCVLHTPRFIERLIQLGYEDDPEFDFEMTVRELKPHGVVSTFPAAAYGIEYRSLRHKAWRNLMICAINEALAQRLFTLRAGDNRFETSAKRGGTLFDFALPNGLPVRGYVSDAGWDELNIHAAVNPKEDWIRAGNAGLEAGDAVGRSWLERRRGAWLQSAVKLFSCRKPLLASLAALEVEPQGYGDRGNVIM